MDILGELQKRGFQVVQCPGRVEISTNKAMRQKAIQDGVTVRDQVNEAIDDIMSGMPDMISSDLSCRKCSGKQIHAPDLHAYLCTGCGVITRESEDS